MNSYSLPGGKLFCFVIFLIVANSVQAQMHFDEPAFIHSEIQIFDNQINLLNHGHHEFSFMVKDGKVVELKHSQDQLQEITDASKEDLIFELLDRKAAEYSKPNSANISLWTKGDFYAIFDINEKIKDSKYMLKFFFIGH